jgi:FkbH-like protein
MVSTSQNSPSAHEIWATLEATPPGSKLRVARAFLERLERAFDREALDVLAEAMSDAGPELIHGVSRSPSGCYLRAKVFSAVGDLDRAADEWAQFFSCTPAPDPWVLLQSVMTWVRLGRYSEAALHLRDLFHKHPPYSLYVRTERLVQRVWEQCPPQLRQCRIALLGSSTTSLLVPVLRALCFRDGINAAFYEGPYGNFRQEILDPESGLYRFRPSVVLLMTHWRDFQLSPLAGDEDAQLDRIVSDLSDLWRRLSEGCGCHIVQHAADFPAEEPYGYLASSLPGGRSRLITRLNLRLATERAEYVSLLDTPAVVAQVGSEVWSDASFWYTAKQHPGPAALPHLAEAQLAHVRAVLGLTRKVAVCDLDNTLWGGVIGEDGLEGIQIGPSSPEGEAYADLQRYLRDLKSRGILLAVCSKNNPEDARLPFIQHKHMVLRLEDFAAFVANWTDKATNLREIAKKLSLGTDSFVVLDDNPVERAWIRSQMPEVAVVELNSSPFRRIRDLHQGQYFYSLTMSAEDQERGKLYRVEAMRESIRSSSGSLQDFLEQLDMQASVSPVTAENIARVTQLTNKTNQFNFTTRRYTQAEIAGLSAREDTWLGVFQLEDRFGTYGIIALIFCVPAKEAQDWEIDLWLMSCRVLGRQMEGFMFDRLLEAARAARIQRLIGVYRPTSKNSQVADLYVRFGFKEFSRSSDETRFVISIDGVQKKHCDAIRYVNPRTASDA